MISDSTAMGNAGKSSSSENLFKIEDIIPSPPLKWAGGKRWLVPTLRKLYAPYRERRLVEPFVGGMSVALGLHPHKALLCDINPHAILLYKWLQKGLRIESPMENSAECFYRSRDRFNWLLAQDDAASAEASGLFYYLNHTAYNGLCRFNSKGFFNVPFGKYAKIKYRREFDEYQRVLSGWEFRCTDFEKIKLRRGDFVYSDPPFDVEFTKYSKEDFAWKDQVRLAKWLAAHPGPVAASNQATPRIMELYESYKFKIQILSAPRMISCTGDRARAKEMLAMKNIE